MNKLYVFTHEQMLKALLHGAKETGLIPGEDVEDALKTLDSVTFDQGENGGAMWIGTSDYLDAEQAGNAALRAQSGGETAPAPAPEEKPKKADGPLASKVRAALGASMSNPPLVKEIRKWSKAERRLALKWARQPHSMERPDFIKEHVKGAVEKVEELAAPPATTPTNGAAKPKESKPKPPPMTGSQKPREVESQIEEEDDDDDTGSASEYFQREDASDD